MTLLTKYGPWALVAGATEGIGRAFELDPSSDLQASHGTRSYVGCRPSPVISFPAEQRAPRAR